MPILKTFSGVRPLVTPRQLPESAAQIAVNCDLTRGDLRPYPQSSLFKTLPGSGAVSSIYRYGMDNATPDDYWFAFATDTDVCRGAIADDVTERTFWTDGQYPKVTDSVRALAGAPYPTSHLRLGIPAPLTAPTVSLTPMASPPTGRVAVDTVYIYTYVNSYGEESAPSPPSATRSILPGDTANLSAMDVAPAGPYDVVTKRIYRLTVGTTSADYLYVDEIPVATTVYNDTKSADDLVEPCPSIDWDAPDAALKGLISLPNGTYAAFKGRDWYVSEPWRPFAWPKKYSMTMDYPIVAHGAFGQSVVVLTTGNPYLITGSEPMAMGMEKLEIREACVSKRSVVQTGDGIIYASPNGLVFIGQSGTKILTEGMFDQALWSLYNPTTLHGYWSHNSYIGFYKDLQGVGHGFVLTPTSFVDIDFYADAGFVDIKRDMLFLAIGRNLHLWTGSANPMTYQWRSKVLEAASPTNLSCAQVLAAGYPVTMKVYADGVLKHTQTVTNSYPFRLPSGFRARDWEFSLEGTSIVYSVALGTSVEELANG